MLDACPLVATALVAVLVVHTAGTMKILLTRAILIAVGIALGYVISRNNADAHGSAALLLFLSGFGLVHLPAAFILFIKRERGSGKS
jgi:uncharacterized membrane protein